MNQAGAPKKHSIEDEARELADYAEKLLQGDRRSFGVNASFCGQEAKLIEGAKNILRTSGRKGISFPDYEDGTISIERE